MTTLFKKSPTSFASFSFDSCGESVRMCDDVTDLLIVFLSFGCVFVISILGRSDMRRTSHFFADSSTVPMEPCFHHKGPASSGATAGFSSAYWEQWEGNPLLVSPHCSVKAWLCQVNLNVSISETSIDIIHRSSRRMLRVLHTQATKTHRLYTEMCPHPHASQWGGSTLYPFHLSLPLS